MDGGSFLHVVESVADEEESTTDAWHSRSWCGCFSKEKGGMKTLSMGGIAQAEGG